MEQVITLNKAVEIDGQKIAELTFNEPTVRELLQIEKQHSGKVAMEKDIELFALACRVDTAVIKSLGARDWAKLSGAYWDMMGNVEKAPAAALASETSD